ncbi:MAG: copper resistance protein CopC [Alphaproteobacteria bacterium]|nr:copper resistance protein CopC [Alphaproteobacteria bacterium]
MPRFWSWLLLGLALTPAPTLAHAVLMASQPATGGSVPAGTVAIVLRFNSRIDRDRSRLKLVTPDHREVVLPLAGEDAPDTLHSASALEPGKYVLSWQVLATDGHLTRGDVPFTVTGP